MLITAIGDGNKSAAIRATLDRLPTEHTSVLLVPTACSIQSAYDRKVGATLKFFNDEMGVVATVLHEFGEVPSTGRIAEEVGRAALVHTIGGNTPHLLAKLKDWGGDTILRQEISSGKPHSGVSAGGLLPAQKIQSNPSAKPAAEEWDFVFLAGLGATKGVWGMHGDKHDETPQGPRPDSRLDHLVSNFPDGDDIGLAVDNGVAVILSDPPEVIKTDRDANAYLLHRNEQSVMVAQTIFDPAQLAVLI